jgi:hypothetical protein
MGLEPTTPTLATWCSTTELHPHFFKGQRSIGHNASWLPALGRLGHADPPPNPLLKKRLVINHATLCKAEFKPI